MEIQPDVAPLRKVTIVLGAAFFGGGVGTERGAISAIEMRD